MPNSRSEDISAFTAIASAKTPTSSGVNSRAIATEPANCRTRCPNCSENVHAREVRMVKSGSS